jgi:two-component system sensor histidine kinase/response regulator
LDTFHSLLRRQMRRHLGESGQIPDSLRAFLDDVNSAYLQSDADRRMLERAMEISSAELLNANRELTAILRSFPDSFLRLAPDGSILDYHWNPSEASESGFPHGTGKSIRDIPDASVADLFNRALTALLRTGARQTLEYTFENGNRRDDYEAIFIPVSDEQILVLIRNITERKRLERAAFLAKMIIENSPAVVLIWGEDTEHPLEYVSENVSQFGYTAEELMTGSVLYRNIVHPQDFEVVTAEAQKMVGSHVDAYTFEYRIIARDGSLRWVEDSTFVKRDSTGEPVKYEGLLHDITHRKKIEEELRFNHERFTLITQSAQDAIICADATGEITFWNAAAERIFGYTADEVAGRGVHSVLAPENVREVAEQAMAHWRLTGEGTSIGTTVETIARHKDGHEFPVELSLSSAKQGDHWQAIGVLRDISARRLEEERKARLMAELESASRAKSQFLANMSHEIRTPLNGILGMTDLLINSPMSENQREYLEVIQESGDALLSVINSILDFAKIEAGKMDLDFGPFDIKALLQNTLRTFNEKAHSQGVQLNLNLDARIPDEVVGDEAKLRQVFLNLIGNALKFTRNGAVSVEAGVEDINDDEVVMAFSVSDTGIGISQDKHSIIFEPFSQADSSTTREYGGTGLGLAITAQLVELMHGRIWVESAPGQGSVFHFSACFGTQQMDRVREAHPAIDTLSGVKTLIVDDNATNRMILDRFLSQWNMNSEAVASGVDALTRLKTNRGERDPIRLIIMDGLMPGMDGFETIDRIRREFQGTWPIIVMLTSSDQPEDEERCRRLGVSGYLRKPVRQEVLLRCIESALGVQSTATSGAASASDTEGMMRDGLKILLAEDNAVNQRVVVLMLERRGHFVTVAHNGQEAVELLEQQSFDVVLMDALMPVLDGYEATIRIRERERGTGRHVPIIALTANAMKGDSDRCLEAGMDGYLAKPVKTDSLLNEIARVLTSLKESSEKDNTNRTELP